MAAEIRADLRLAFIQQIVVNRRDRIDHQRAVFVLFGEQRFDLGGDSRVVRQPWNYAARRGPAPDAVPP